MTTLVNAMHVNTTATNQVMERMNGNGNGFGGNSTDGGLMTLATFLKVNPPTFKALIDLTETDNWFQMIERAMQAQHVPESQLVEFAVYQLSGEA
ncbi:hypothetical protein AHAS_Ahas20G0171700 [Arachis hypogaea]